MIFGNTLKVVYIFKIILNKDTIKLPKENKKKYLSR